MNLYVFIWVMKCILDPRIGADENPKYLMKMMEMEMTPLADSLSPGSPPGTPRPQSPRTPREVFPWWEGPIFREDPPQPEVEEELNQLLET